MSRGFKVLIAVTVVVAIIFIAVGTTGASVEPQMVRVTLKDYQIGISQFTVLPGKVVTFVVSNQGEMAHKLVVRPYVGANNANTFVGPVIGAHTAQSFQFILTPGIYLIECVQATHIELGMVSTIAAQAPQAFSFPLDMNFVISMLGLVLGSTFLIFDSLGFRVHRMTSA